MKLRMDALHYALLAVLVLLVFYAASTYGLFKEHHHQQHNRGRRFTDTQRWLNHLHNAQLGIGGHTVQYN